MIDDHDPGPCPRCGAALEVRGTEPGIRRYWVCDDHRRPVVILPPENVGWAFAEALTDIQDTFDTGTVDGLDEPVTSRVCDRLESGYQRVREHNRTRHLSQADREHAGEQPALSRWSA